jgi:hypothetical protein
MDLIDITLYHLGVFPEWKGARMRKDLTFGDKHNTIKIDKCW